MKKRLISLLLAFSMMLTFLPAGAVSAFAEGTADDTTKGELLQNGDNIEKAGTYQLYGNYNQGIKINTEGPVVINVTGNVTVDVPKNDNFITIKKADSVTINGDAQYPVTVNGGGVILNEGENLTVDGGKYICNGRNSYSSAFTLSNGINRVKNVTIESKYDAIYVTYNCNSAVIEYSEITMHYEGSAYEGGIVCRTNGKLDLDHVTVHALKGNALELVCGTITIEDGEYTSDARYAIQTYPEIDDAIDLTITGGTYKSISTNRAVAALGCYGTKGTKRSNIKINGSKLIGNNQVLWFDGDGAETLTIDGDTTLQSTEGTADAVIVGDGQLIFKSGTIEVPDGSEYAALRTYDTGEAIVDGGTFKGAKYDIREQYNYDRMPPCRVQLKNANFDDTVCNVYLDRNRQIDVAQNYTGQVTIECADPSDGRQLTKDTETNYQKDLNLTSANAGYLVGYKKTTDGKGEYRCLSKKVGVTVSDLKSEIKAEVDINITPETPNAAGYGIAAHGDSNITFKNGTEAEIKVTSENPDAGTWGIYNERGGTGNLTVNDSTVDIDANRGIYAGFQKVEIANNSVVTSKNTHQAMYALGGSDGKGLKLRVTGNSRYHLTGGTRGNWGIQATSARGHEILVDDNGQLISDMENSYTAVGLGKNAKLVVDNGTVLVRGKYDKAGLFAYGDNSTIHIKNNSHVEATTITLNPSIKKIPTVGQKLIVTGGTLTYDYSADNTLWPVNEQGDKLTNFLLTKDDTHANFDALSYNGQTYTYLSDLNKETGKQYLSVWVPAAALNYMLDVDGSHDPEIIGKALEELKQAGYNFDTAYQTAENGDQVVILRDMVVNGKSLNFTKTTDAEGNTKLIWGNYEKQAEGAPSAYDMVYGTEYEYEGKTYTIVWGYESQNNPNTTAAAGVLDAFGPDSNVKVTGETIDGTDSAQYTVTIYGALREVTDPVIPTNPKPETPEDSDPTPPAPTTPTTPAVQDARPTTPAVEQAVAKTTPAPETPVNPPVQDARPESGKLIQTGTTNWMADVLVRAGGVLLAAGYLLERKRKSMFHKAQH